MTWKRRKFNNGASSRVPSSRGRSPSRPQPFARLSSVPRSIPPSSPALPQLPRQNRVSLRPNSSHASSAYRDQDVVRAPIREPDAEIQAREDSDAMNEVIMAVEMRDPGAIGCAYYIAREEKLCLMEDIKMAGLDIIDTLKLHAQPTFIIISTRSDEKLEDHLNKDARGIDRGDEASEFLYIFPRPC